MGIFRNGLEKIIDGISSKAFEVELTLDSNKIMREGKQREKQIKRDIQKKEIYQDISITKKLDEKYNEIGMKYSKNVDLYLRHLKEKNGNVPVMELAKAISTQKYILYTICCMSGEISKLQQIKNISTSTKELINGIAKLFGYGKLYGEADIADVSTYDVKNIKPYTTNPAHLLSVDDILDNCNSDWYIEYKDRKAISREKQCSDKREILVSIVNLEPLRDSELIAYRIVKLLEKDKYELLSLLEVYLQDGRTIYLYTDKKEIEILSDKIKKAKGNYEANNSMGKYYYSPIELYKVASALEYVLPRFKEAIYTVSEDGEIVPDESFKLPETRDTYFMMKNEVDKMDFELLKIIATWWKCWTINNYEQKFGVDPAIFWKKKISPFVENVRTIEKERKKEEILSAGEEGEKIVEYALKWIAPNFHVLERTSEGKNGKKCILIENLNYIDEPQEIDHIVVGETGVFLIETKYYSGSIEIDQFGNWKRNKNGVSKVETNPLQQIRRHEKIVKSILKEDIHVHSVLCLAHPEVTVEGTENFPLPIVRSDMLVEYIETFKLDNKLSHAEIDNIIRIFKKHMK